MGGAWTSVSQAVPPPILGSEDVLEIFVKFDFDEEGKINSVVWSVDSGALQKLKSLSPVSTQFSAWRDPMATSLGAFYAAACFSCSADSSAAFAATSLHARICIRRRC